MGGSRWLSMAVAALSLASALAVVGSPYTCSNDFDCSYNGMCVHGKCSCEPQFKGDACDAFNFAPLDISKGEGLRTIRHPGYVQVSSWGGSVLLDDDNVMHMWAAEMTDSTGIKAWLTNSQVVHAVANNSAKPFHFQRNEVVWPVFSHEPTVSRAPTGEFVMYFTTNYGDEPDLSVISLANAA